MIKQNVTIINSIGLHARPATYLVQKATSFRCKVKIAKDQQEVNGKSLLGVLSLGIAKGMTISVITDGEDEATAMAEIIALIQTGLEE